MRIFRWAVRICSLLFIAYQTLSFVGDSWPTLSSTQEINLLVWGIILLGMLVAWISEGMGGLIIIFGFIIQVALHPVVLTMWGMWVAPAIGALFVISWAMSEEQILR